MQKKKKSGRGPTLFHTTVYILVLSKLTQIHFNGTNFFNARLTQRVFSVWPVAQPVVGEMEMHSVANIADPFSDFFPFKKAPKPSFWETPVLPCEREVLLSQRAHTPLSLSLCVCSVSL